MADLQSPQNGGYPNPPAIKRQLRDPYGDWWDKQERRNYGEIVHEDNDLLGVFTPHDYTHFSSSKAFGLFGFFLLGVAGICGVTYIYYPDKPSVPKTYEGGLEKELGGETVVIVSSRSLEVTILGRVLTKSRQGKRVMSGMERLSSRNYRALYIYISSYKIETKDLNKECSISFPHVIV